ncbi:Cytochrome b subunit of formate dehydrogenase [Halobiforma haloterrestris]|uniref:Cytochrome b subunit of formate dehydrogenase n=1 Tax=Natronobacterium haloterrestre TaxID=148448 RepID=A0A1I1DFB5_NATHA|nr:cytochrome b/b6 domain-containing protein [Halobiforma haloterrestris]SFB73635.1 Cytochrome b subunit of formate dehydrogenase [Halobiforma haloterrestris]
MTNLDHGKFSRVTTTFHSLLALTVFVLFFTGYAIAFNTELWWLVELMGGNEGVLSIHRAAGFALIALTGFWVPFMLLRSSSRGNFSAILPSPDDLWAFLQDVKFALGMADERHPAARQFAGFKAEETPLISYIGKGVIWIFTVELILLMITGLLIWRKTWLIDAYNSQSAAMAFVAFHGLLGIIMLMGVMFHTFEHGLHPAFYPVEMKAFLPKDQTPNFHDDPDEYETTGIERLRRRPSWGWAMNVTAVLAVVGIVSVMMASLEYGGYPVPDRLVFGEGSVLRTIGINAGIFVLLLGLVLSMYGNVLRARYLRQRRERERERQPSGTAADGGDPGGTARSDGGEPTERDERGDPGDGEDGTSDG